ncbi:unnamed protein product [Linum trigynum]|uniref:Protein FAR1-RELATED SEQUENCE n=1 Tax=Linum trigynum TaxID=586398 RepID=A0AAV2D5F7_9ROSI
MKFESVVIEGSPRTECSDNVYCITEDSAGVLRQEEIGGVKNGSGTTPCSVELADRRSESDAGGYKWVPVAGTSYSSAEEIFMLYQNYAVEKGFAVNKDGTTKNKKGEIVYCRFCCHRARKPSEKLKPKPSRRVNCGARIYCSKGGDGRWKISKVNDQHNHDMAPCRSWLLQQHRNSSLRVQSLHQLDDSVDVHTIAEKGYRTMGQPNSRRYVGEERNLWLEGNANAMSNLFNSMQKQSKEFFYAYDLDYDGRLRSVLWVDARSRAAYAEFGDVITVDTTYFTNKYHVPVVPFVGLNHHGHSILLGCALISDGDTETFEWLFRTWLECMESPPTGIVTDQFQSIGKAITNVFPNARHRWCIQYILEKLPEKFGCHSRYDELCVVMKNCVYQSLSIAEFQGSWKNMVNEFKLEDNEWVEELYLSAEKWVPAFVIDTFWSGWLFSQRSESRISYFDESLNSNTSLKQFLELYQVVLKVNIEKEMAADYSSCVVPIQCATKLAFEEQFQKIYTNSIFRLVQEQLTNTIYCFEEVASVEGGKTAYIVDDRIRVGYGGLKNKKFRVVHDDVSGEASCNCRMFEFEGILCSHIFRVLLRSGVEVIHDQYIMKKWRKDIRRGLSNIRVGYAGEVFTPEMERFERLEKRFKELANVACGDDEKYRYLLNSMQEIEKCFAGWNNGALKRHRV